LHFQSRDFLGNIGISQDLHATSADMRIGAIWDTLSDGNRSSTEEYHTFKVVIWVQIPSIPTPTGKLSLNGRAT
jgi:hypothetical protein